METYFPFDETLKSTDGTQASFTRASTATNPDTGATVATGEPRFVAGKFGQAVLVEEGTTNLAPRPDYSNRVYGQKYVADSWGGDAADVYYYASGGYGGIPYKKLVKTTAGNGGSYLDDHSPIAIEDNATYVISGWMRASRDVYVDAYALCINRISDNVYRTGPSGLSLTTQWQRFSWVYSAEAGHAGDYQARHIIYADENLPLEVYWSGFQVEKKPYATSFVDGTRAGEALISSMTLTKSSASIAWTKTATTIGCSLALSSIRQVAGITMG